MTNINKLSNKQGSEQLNGQSDDSLAYTRSLENAEAESQYATNDPLADVKNMRLQQLAACRIKTANQLQAKMDKTKADQSGSE